jgi:hypothetical protein
MERIAVIVINTDYSFLKLGKSRIINSDFSAKGGGDNGKMLRKTGCLE